MRILHIQQYYRDCWGYHENLLPQYHSDAGHNVTVITSIEGTVARKSHKPITYKSNGVRIIRLPIWFGFKGRFVVFKSLLKVIKKEAPDYIFHHSITSPSLLTAVKYKNKNPSVFLTADNHADHYNSGRNKLWRIIYYQLVWKLALKVIIRSIDIIFGVTPARCLFPENILGIPKDKIRLLPLGADIKEVAKLDRSVKITNMSECQEIILVTGGKWSEEKELYKLISAVAGLKVRLIIFGEIVDFLTSQMIENTDNVEFAGWLNRKQTLKLLLEADMAVWTKQHTTLIEDAIATETPLILRYHGSTSHLIRGNGLYCFTSNPIEIRHLVSFVVDNKNILEDMRICAKKMKDLLSYERIARESIDYSYDMSPKNTHSFFMNSWLCDYSNPGFEKTQ